MNISSSKQYEQLPKDLCFIIVDGSIRQERCLGNTSLSFETRNCMFLPKCYFAKMSVIRYHKLFFHNGLKETLNEIRTKY